MSWTKGNKKWTIPFVSLNNTTCRIDIYQRGYTGSTVTELSTLNVNAPGVAATDPIYFEEDDDQDLLKVLRYKTGYINLVETVYGGLSELYPTKNNMLYVEFYYGSRLDFVGFIQAQSFENPWRGAPREMSIPIISPLGLLYSIKMPVYNPPQAITLAAALDDALDALYTDCGVEYIGITWPQLSTGLDATISSLVTSPFNDDKMPGNGEPLFSPITAGQFVEGLCNCFGWMLHEMTTQLVFSMFDHSTNYNYVLTQNLRTLSNVTQAPYTGDTSIPLTGYGTPADNNGRESGVMPLKKVTLEYDGEYVKNCKLDFNHFIYNGGVIDGNQAAAWLTSQTPELTAGNVPLQPSNTLHDGKLVAEGTTPCSCGTLASQTECLLVNLPQQGVTVGWLFTVKYYNRPTGDQLKISWRMRWGDTLLTLTDDETVLHKMVGVKIKVGDLWYQGGGVWNTTEPNPYHYGSGEYYWYLNNVPQGMPIEVRFYEEAQQAVSHRVQTLTIEDLKIEEQPTMWSDYRYVQPDEDNIENGNGDGEGEASVSMLFSPYRLGSNMVGTSLVTQRFTNYGYLLRSNARWQIRFKQSATIPQLIYMVYASFMSQQWRVISLSQYPWDDEVVITLQRSIG